MNRFDITRSMELARYWPGSSPVHRLHPGAKLLLLVVGMVTLAVAPGVAQLTALLLLILGVTASTGVPFALPIGSLRRAFPWLLFVVLIQVLTVPSLRSGTYFGGFWIFQIHGGQIFAGIEGMLRYSDLILFLALGMAVTHVRELSYAVEALSSPMERIGLPLRGFILSVTIALYFIPLFATEAGRILKSQAARGAAPPRGGLAFLRTLKLYLPLFVPLIVLALRHAENLALAMESRGFQSRAKRNRLILHAVDSASILSVAVAGILLAVALVNPLSGLDHLLRGVLGALS